MSYPVYQEVIASAGGTTPWLLLAPERRTTITVEYAAGANATTTVEHSNSLVSSPSDSSAIAIASENMTNIGGSMSKSILTPMQAVRLNVTSYVSGNIKLIVRQV